MKQKIILLGSVFILVGILITCQRDDTDNNKLPPVNKEAELAAAKQWYNSQFGELTIKSAAGDSSRRKRVVLKPDWEKARVHYNRRLKTVEATLTPHDTALFFATPENKQKYQETSDERYLMMYSRFVVQTHRRSERKTGFMMTIMNPI